MVLNQTTLLIVVKSLIKFLNFLDSKSINSNVCADKIWNSVQLSVNTYA